MRIVSATGDYFSELARSFGEGWNRFWFTPIDPLPLSVVRVGCGLVALYVVATFSFDLDRLFGPDGMLPLDAVVKIQSMKEFTASPDTDPPNFRFSYLDSLTTSQGLWAGHMVGIAILTAFTLGLWTRLTSVAALVVFVSYIQRGPMLTWLVEPVIVFMLFYLCFGPSGAYLSIDSLLAKRRAAATAVPRRVPASWGANIALRLIQIHICAVYVMMVLSKLFSDVWWNGEAMWFLAAKPESRLVDLTWLYQHKYFFNIWTHSQVLYELTFPVLIWNRLARPLVIAAGVVLFTMLTLVTGAASFGVAMLVGSLAFVPAAGLRKLAACFSRS